MMTPNDPRRIAAALSAGLALSLPATLFAQGPGLSSGSGPGTGTGASAVPGLGGTGTGRESSSGLGTTGTGYESGTSRFLPGTGRMGTARPGGPLETLIDPLAGRPILGLDITDEEAKAMDAQLVEEARSIREPGEKALTLMRMGRYRIFERDFEKSHDALFEAGQAALQEPEGLVRDLRLRGIVETLIDLAEARTREALTEDPALVGPDEPLPGRPPAERVKALKGAQEEWDYAARMSSHIARRAYRSESLYEVANSQALQSQSIAFEAGSGRLAGVAGEEASDVQGPLNDLADGALVKAARHAWLINDMPAWRDRTLVAVTSGAAAAGQYDRGMQIARAIPLPEARADALMRLAEAEARHDAPKAATIAYNEAARAVAAIPNEDLRSTLGSVLIDSLISSGRFDDARASIVLYPDNERRLKALGAVAESQGRRGLAPSARGWIDRDVPVTYRPQLHRRVNDGVLASLQQYRSNIENNRTSGPDLRGR
jgi:hypothetical protein